MLDTLEGWMNVFPNSYICLGVEGDVWVVREGIFNNRYRERTPEDGFYFKDFPDV